MILSQKHSGQYAALCPIDPPATLRDGLADVAGLFPERFGDDDGCLPVRFLPLPDAAAPTADAAVDSGGITIRHSDAARAFRALGRLMGQLATGRRPTPFTETAAFTRSGIMLDCSRNAVPTVDTLRRWLVHAALMGLDTLLLYTEDTYEIPGEPFWGYGRGRYTQAELRALDGIAAGLGIELVPSIQALGHLAQPLRWELYRPLRDQEDVLLIDEPKTYELLEKMIAAASAPLRSKNIHLGMDEAHGVGLGRYHARHGPKDRLEIFLRHLDRVRELCRARGLTPWIWSDMLFQLAAPGADNYGNYRNRHFRFPEGTVNRMPPDVKQVYWDYTSLDAGHYRDLIRNHRGLGVEPALATSAWTSGRMVPALSFARLSGAAALEACRAEGVKETFITLWGDNGAEADFLSALPVVQEYAEWNYADAPAEADTAERFLGSVGGDWREWLSIDGVDRLPGWTVADGMRNPSKWLLWQDPMLSIMDPYIDPERVAGFYAGEAERLGRLAAASGPGGVYDFPACLARVLALKTPLRARLSAAIGRGDRETVRTLRERALPSVVAAARELWHLHRSCWMARNKPNGWEVLDGRYGGLLARLDTLGTRLDEWLGAGVPVPELTETFARQPAPLDSHVLRRGYYDEVATPSVVR